MIQSPPTQSVTLDKTTGLMGFWTSPLVPSPWPVIVLFAPMAATADHLIDLKYHLVKAGFAVLTFDWPHYGHSAGSPRHHIALPSHEAAVGSVGTWLTTQPHIKPNGITYWAISLGATHVLNHLKNALIQPDQLILHTPFISGFHSLREQHDLDWLTRLQRLAHRAPNRSLCCTDTTQQPGLLSGPRAEAFYAQGPTPYLTLSGCLNVMDAECLSALTHMNSPPPSYWIIAQYDQVIAPDLTARAFQAYQGPKSSATEPMDHYTLLLNETIDPITQACDWIHTCSLDTMTSTQHTDSVS